MPGWVRMRAPARAETTGEGRPVRHGAEQKDEQPGEQQGGDRHAEPEITGGPSSILRMSVHDLPQFVVRIDYRAPRNIRCRTLECDGIIGPSRKPMGPRDPFISARELTTCTSIR